MIEVICPRCSNALHVTPLDIGTTGHCSKCKGHICILESLEPVPHAEAPAANLARDPGPTALQDMDRRMARAASEGNPPTQDEVERELVVRILIDLNQLHHLVRYARNEIPETKEFEPDRAARKVWADKNGQFGIALLESNMVWRMNNIREAAKRLKDANFMPELARTLGGLEEVRHLKTGTLHQAVELTKTKLRLSEPEKASSNT